MEFSKKLIIFACLIAAAAFGVAVFNWFETREGLDEILAFARWAVVLMFGYCAKSAYENKAKIETGYLDKKNGKAGGK